MQRSCGNFVYSQGLLESRKPNSERQNELSMPLLYRKTMRFCELRWSKRKQARTWMQSQE